MYLLFFLNILIIKLLFLKHYLIVLNAYYKLLIDM